MFRLLFVCTGNICRSAAAERLARRQLDAALGNGASLVSVASAGTRAVVGAPIHPDSAAVVRSLGGDTDGFQARRLRRHMVAEADLVLTMTRAHRQTCLELEPRALSRTFTLHEAADLLRSLRPPVPHDRAPGAVAPVGRWPATAAGTGLVADLAAARRRRSGDARDDIADPVNRPPEVHREVLGAVLDDLTPILDALVSELSDRDRRAPGGRGTG